MIILYPTETIYGLGVNPFDAEALKALYLLKGREEQKAVSWLVRDIADIEQYAEVSDVAAKIASLFLPGPLTLVLPIRKDAVPAHCTYETVGFRISTDEVAQKIIAEHMAQHSAPLTCTSANVSGMETGTIVADILAQFGERKSLITDIYDDGPRRGVSSTVVQVVGDDVVCLREGVIPFAEILQSIQK